MDGGLASRAKSRVRRGKETRRAHKPGGTSRPVTLRRRVDDSRSRRTLKRAEALQQWRLDSFGSCPAPTTSEIADWFQNLNVLVTEACSGEVIRSGAALMKLKRLLFYGELGVQEEAAYLKAIHCSSLMERMCSFMQFENDLRVQCLELLCVLSYIPTQRNLVAEIFQQTVIQCLIEVVASTPPVIAVKAMQILGSIATMHAKCHLLIQKCNAFRTICQRVLTCAELDNPIPKYASFAIMMITGGEESDQEINMMDFIPAAEMLMTGISNPELHRDTLAHTAVAICNVTSPNPSASKSREMITESNLFLQMMRGLECIRDEEALLYLMRSVCYITTEKDILDELLDKGLAKSLNVQMTRDGICSDLRRDMCEIANNLVMDSPSRLEVLIKYNFLDIMGEYVMREDFSVKKMAVLVLANSAAVASDEVIRDCFVNQLIIKSFVKVLDAMDDAAAYYGVAGLNTILASGELTKQEWEDNHFAEIIEELGGRDGLDRLTIRENENLSETAREVLNDFYDSKLDFENFPPT